MPLRNHLDASAPFFISYTGSKITKGTAYCWFRKILRMAGIPFIGDHRGPRVHDLRHTFAVHSLMKQVRSGRDIYCLLPILSVFMGHKTLAGTEHYVRLTSEIFPELNMQIGEVSWSSLTGSKAEDAPYRLETSALPHCMRSANICSMRMLAVFSNGRRSCPLR